MRPSYPIVTVLMALSISGLPNRANGGSAPGQKENAAKRSVHTVIELREGGNLQPMPHPWQIRVHADGLVQTRHQDKHLSLAEVSRLLKRLKAFGFWNMTSESLVKQLHKADELRQIAEGGSGVVTLWVHTDGKTHEVTFSHPDVYTKTSVRSVQRFLQALDAVRALAK